jgi:hypothetical protein
MTQDDRNIEIAKSVGIKQKTSCPACYGTGYGGSESDHIPCWQCKTTGVVEPYYDCPNYAKDRDAIIEVIKTIPVDDCFEHPKFCGILCNLLGIDEYETRLFGIQLVTAPADVLCQAYLTYLGKWQ